MSGERVWDVHAPNIEPRQCRTCGATFYPEHHRFIYCPKHSTKRHPKSAAPALITRTCVMCGQEFTFKRGRGSGNRAKCDLCLQTKDIGAGAAKFAMNDGHDLFHPDREIAERSNIWDDEYARIEEDYLLAQQAVLEYLEANEIVYGRSITEHHQRPLIEAWLELAIERVNPKKVQAMRAWARDNLNGHKPESVERVWAPPALTKKEQWVINFLKKKRN